MRCETALNCLIRVSVYLSTRLGRARRLPTASAAAITSRARLPSDDRRARCAPAAQPRPRAGYLGPCCSHASYESQVQGWACLARQGYKSSPSPPPLWRADADHRPRDRHGFHSAYIAHIWAPPDLQGENVLMAKRKTASIYPAISFRPRADHPNTGRSVRCDTTCCKPVSRSPPSKEITTSRPGWALRRRNVPPCASAI